MLDFIDSSFQSNVGALLEPISISLYKHARIAYKAADVNASLLMVNELSQNTKRARTLLFA